MTYQCVLSMYDEEDFINLLVASGGRALYKDAMTYNSNGQSDFQNF